MISKSRFLSFASRGWLFLLGGLLLFSSCSPTNIETIPKRTDVALKEKPSFSLDIQPILNEYCVKCHQPRDAHKGLRLNTYQDLMAGSVRGPMVVAGKPQESLLVQVIKQETSPALWMPFHQEPLTPHRIRNIENWIANGAVNN